MIAFFLAGIATAQVVEWREPISLGIAAGWWTCDSDWIRTWDADGDGRLDLVIGQTVVRARGDGYAQPQPILSDYAVWLLDAGDVDDDGVDELIVSAEIEGRGQVGIVETTGYRMVEGPAGADRAPWEGGVLWRAGDPTLWAWFGRQGIYTAAGPDFDTWEFLQKVPLKSSVSFLDIDGDGSTDQLYRVDPGEWGGGWLTALVGPDFTDGVALDVSVPIRLHADGLVSFVSWNGAWLQEQTSPWSFVKPRPFVPDDLLYPRYADLDGDGGDDVLGGGRMHWNEGGNLGPRYPIGFTGCPVDADGDGDDDLVFELEDGMLGVAISEGLRELPPAEPLPPQPDVDAAGGCRTVPGGSSVAFLLGLIALAGRRQSSRGRRALRMGRRRC